MAKKEKTPVFTTEFALKTDSHQTRKLNLKFEAMTSLYNQLLKFLLKQHEKLKKDRDYLNTVEKYRMNKKALIESQNTLFLLEKSANKKSKVCYNIIMFFLNERLFYVKKKDFAYGCTCFVE